MQAGFTKQRDRFVRHPAVGFASRRPVGKARNQGLSARDQIFVSRGFDGMTGSGRWTHDSFPFNGEPTINGAARTGRRRTEAAARMRPFATRLIGLLALLLLPAQALADVKEKVAALAPSA